MNHVFTITMAQESHPPRWPGDALAAVKPRHWLLDTIFGRELLKHRLVQLVPSVAVSLWSECHKFDAVFDLLIDDLGLRGWERPKSMRARVAYFRTIVRLGRQLLGGAAR